VRPPGRVSGWLSRPQAAQAGTQHARGGSGRAMRGAGRGAPGQRAPRAWSLCSETVWLHVRVARSHSLTLLSEEPLAKALPSGWHETLSTQDSWPAPGGCGGGPGDVWRWCSGGVWAQLRRCPGRCSKQGRCSWAGRRSFQQGGVALLAAAAGAPARSPAQPSG
jgi:hypothetical protein